LVTTLSTIQGKRALLLASPVSLSRLPNYCALHDIDELLKDNNPVSQKLADVLQQKGPQYVKQRSSVWFAMRKEVRVTGSTIYAATGAGGLKAQREHFLQVTGFNVFYVHIPGRVPILHNIFDIISANLQQLWHLYNLPHL